MTWTAAAAREHYHHRKRLGVKRTRRSVPQSKFDIGEFVAIDGEGFNEGPEIEAVIGEQGRVYRTRQHNYALLSGSDGAELYSENGRLSTAACLDFLIDRTRETRPAILVCFGGSYDVTKMLHDLSRDDIELLLHGDGSRFARKYTDVSFGDYDYRIECRPRKSLSVWRWPAGADKYERHTRKDGSWHWRMTKCDKATLWDVWGFFQGSYVGALQAWLPDDPDTPLIIDMKAKRSTFDRADIDLVREYNRKECRTLVDMMNKVRDAVRDMGVKITRWDGAGAIASALYRQHDIKQHMAQSPAPVFDAACHAYSGGHIEMVKFGYHKGKVHHYDINSAYPHQFVSLPCLASGRWSQGHSNPPRGFTLVRVAYRFLPGLPFYPLFYRETAGTILYPERGHGWYWYPEFEVAQRFAGLFGAIEFRVIEWWHYQTGSNVRPFEWVNELYNQRRDIIMTARAAGIEPPGSEKTMKLGYNALYGKAGQQVGARYVDGEIVAPAYFQIEWAGYVTAGCRAQIMGAAMQRPWSIIGFATDGLFADSPLDLPVSPTKELGAWEYQIHDGITMVMPGVYWLHDGDKVKHYSRGFDKRDMAEATPVHRAWARRQSSLDVNLERLVTLGTALTSDTFWELRGCFVKTTRTLALNGCNSKRWVTALHDKQPHKRLIDTRPRDLAEDYDQDVASLLSAPYAISWLEPDAGDMPDADAALNDDVLAAFLV